MIFGIKTKKDKRIEELEKLLDYMSATAKPHIATIERDVVTLKCKQILEPGMPVEFAKHRIARDFTEHIETQIDYDIRDSDTPYPVIEGTLRVVVQKGGTV